MLRTIGWIEWETCAQFDVALILPQVHDVEEPQDHVVTSVVSGVPDNHILEQTTVVPQDLVHP